MKQFVTLVSVISCYSVSATSIIHDVSPTQLTELVVNNFFVFVADYSTSCPGTSPELFAFSEVARVWDEPAPGSYLQFARVDRKRVAVLYRESEDKETVCQIKLSLHKYEKEIQYGTHPDILSSREKSRKAIYAWLVSQTGSRVVTLETGDQVEAYVKGYESTVVAYFEDRTGDAWPFSLESSGLLNRRNFYEAADSLVGYGYNFAEVRNPALVNEKRQKYRQALDTILVTVKFGNISQKLDGRGEALLRNRESNEITTESIKAFVKKHSVATGPILQAEFGRAGKSHKQQFTRAGDLTCDDPKTFGTTALFLESSGMLAKLNMSVVKVEIDARRWSLAKIFLDLDGKETYYGLLAKKMKRFGLSSGDSYEYCEQEPETLMRIFKYRRMIKYNTEDESEESSEELGTEKSESEESEETLREKFEKVGNNSGGTATEKSEEDQNNSEENVSVESTTEETPVEQLEIEELPPKTVLEWIQESIQPTAETIRTQSELQLITEYNEVAILGYFENNGDGHLARIEFYNASDSMRDYVWGDVVTKELNPYEETTIVFYSNFGQSQSHLIQENGTLTTRQIQDFVQKLDGNRSFSVPTKSRTMLTRQESEHILLFKGDGTAGSKKLVLNRGGCAEMPDGVWVSVNTFGDCVDLYELPDCEGASYRVNSSRAENVDLTIVQKFGELRSIRGCASDVGSNFMALILVIGGCFLAFLCIIVVIVYRIKRRSVPVAI